MHLLERIRHAIGAPRAQLTRWQRAIRFGYDLGRFGAGQLREDRAPQLAAALSFRTLFGLVPTLVVATVVIKATQGVEGVQALVRQMAQALNLDRFQMITPEEAARVEAATPGTGDAATPMTVAEWLVDIAGRASELNFTAIGLVGLAAVIYSAISLMVTIEKAFNTIYRAPEGRSWMNRLLVYWAVLTLGPAAVGLSFWVDSQWNTIIHGAVSLGWLLTLITVFSSLAMTWLVLFGCYKLIPNTAVSAKSAAVGALVAAVLLEIGKESLGAYFQSALSLKQLYGSLGLVPLFMFWVYVMWLVVMFGLEVASTLQSLHGRHIEELQKRPPATGLIDPARVVSVVEGIAEHFADGKGIAAAELSQQLLLPELMVERILERLHAEEVLHRVDRPECGYTLARPPESILAEELLRIGFDLVDEGNTPPSGGLIWRLRQVQRNTVAGVTLRSNVLPTGPG